MNEKESKLYKPKELIYRVQVEFNPKRCEQDLRQIKPEQESTLLAFIRLYASSQNMRFVDEFTKRTFSEVRKPPHYEADPQPEGFKSSVALYDYQLDAITWMKTVELEMPEVEYTELIPWRVPDSTLYFTMDGKTVWSDRGLSEYFVKANPKGGILADEMGLGKTVEMLGLILANPAEGPSDELSENPPQKEVDDLYYTPATLVLCPSHTIASWQEEIAKFVDKEFHVITLEKAAKLSATSYREICQADLVLVSYELLKNPNYFRIGESGTLPVRMDEEILRHRWTYSHLKYIRGQPNRGLDQKYPILEHFIWHRLVLDEGHEVMDIPFYANTIGAYIADNKWYMTGTPFGKGSDLMRNVVQFLEFPASNSFMSWSQFEPMLETRFWRNTRKSTTGESENDVYSEEVFLLEFTPVERLIYADIGEHEDTGSTKTAKDRQREFCSFPLRSYPSLSVSRARFIQHVEQRIYRNTCELPKESEFLAFLQKIDAEKIDQLSGENERESRFVTYLKKKAYFERAELIETTIVRTKKQIENYENGKIRDQELLTELTQLPPPYSGPDLSARAYIKRTDIKDGQEVGNEVNSTLLSDAEIIEMNVHELRRELKNKGVKSNFLLPKNELQEMLSKIMGQERERIEREEREERGEKRKAEEEQEEREGEGEGEGYVSWVKRARTGDETTFSTMESVTTGNVEEGKSGGGEKEEERQKEEAKEKEKTTSEEEKKDEEADEIKRKKDDQEMEIGKEEKEEKEKGEKKEEKEEKKEEQEKKEDEDEKEEEGEPATEQMIRDFLIEKQGTKLGNVLLFMKKLWATQPRARVMIFSQFNALLDQIFTIFDNNGIPTAHFVGNVLQGKTKLSAIEHRDYPTFKVLLLSLENCPKGTLLVECSHIILMDPLNGTSKDVATIESHAIARAYRYGQTRPIKVVRMLIKDTIEHDLYKQNHSNVQDVSSLVRSASSLLTG
eukprot:Phypoly_transcript_01597.p1 GENE.Phypoly_transcript_01597~~Phypoly_transcript_01597.p1  ORF type:complete len:1093 (+),score=215.01 Phypoly_transcript_01597:397-3279(+)